MFSHAWRTEPHRTYLLISLRATLFFAIFSVRENRDKIEMYLAFGASRFEACKPIAIEGLRLALLPTINQMSVVGEHLARTFMVPCCVTL